MKNVFYTLSSDSVTLYYEGEIYTTTSDSKFWSQIKDAVKKENWEALRNYIDLSSGIKAYAKSSKGAIEVRDGAVFFHGTPIHGALIDRILDMQSQGFEIKPLVALLENIMKNPSYSSREQLYRFLEANKLPITPDGCFLAYKRIRKDWTDCYTGKFDNSIGKVVSMHRALVDDDPNRTCSAGLHVCSLEYLGHFWGERVVAVKVNPKDVVSVPVDYHNSKMRVAEYTVVEELKQDFFEEGKDVWDTAVVNTDKEEVFVVVTTDLFTGETYVYDHYDENFILMEDLHEDCYFDDVTEAVELVKELHNANGDYGDPTVRAVLTD